MAVPKSELDTAVKRHKASLESFQEARGLLMTRRKQLLALKDAATGAQRARIQRTIEVSDKVLGR
jgi:hypothetical protein